MLGMLRYSETGIEFDKFRTINYEISLEVKRKKLIELKEEKVQEAKLIYAEREELNNYIK